MFTSLTSMLFSFSLMRPYRISFHTRTCTHQRVSSRRPSCSCAVQPLRTAGALSERAAAQTGVARGVTHAGSAVGAARATGASCSKPATGRAEAFQHPPVGNVGRTFLSDLRTMRRMVPKEPLPSLSITS